MMPTVIQFHTPVRYYPNADAHPDHTAPAFLSEPEDRWVRGVVSSESHVNVLVQCSGISMASGFEEMSMLCASTPLVCPLPGDLRLPDHPPRHLMIGDVSTLTFPQQLEFFDWLDRFADVVQVVSLTSTPLWPLVEQGRFFEDLFYRLNVVTVIAGPSPIRPCLHQG
jgi:hypothetical protein